MRGCKQHAEFYTLPPRCYGRIAPRSGLALKKFIDVGPGVIDSNYRGELGVILFNFSDENFVVNQVDKIAQLNFEKLKTPTIKGTDRLEETGRGAKGYGSTGINSDQSIQAQENKRKMQISFKKQMMTRLRHRMEQSLLININDPNWKWRGR